MQNQPMVRVEQEFFGDEFHQFVFHFADVFAGREFGAVGHAENVRVHGHHGLPECGVEHDVGSFSPHAGQGFQLFARAGDFAAVLLHQNFAGFDDVLGFGFVKPDGARVLHNALQSEVEHGLRRVGHGKEFGGGFVHAHVSGLCRQQHGNQELERGAELQFGGGVRVGFAPTFKHFGADVLVHNAGAGCFFVAVFRAAALLRCAVSHFFGPLRHDPFGRFDKFHCAHLFQQIGGIVGNAQQFQVGHRHEALFSRVAQHGDERVEKAVHIQKADGFAALAQLQQGDDFKQFFISADAAGHGDKSVGQLNHFAFALGHGVGGNQAVQARVRVLFVDEEMRNHAGGRAAVFQDAVGNHAHQPAYAAAVHQMDLLLRQYCAKLFRVLAVIGNCAVIGAAVNGNIVQRTHESTYGKKTALYAIGSD